VIYLTFRKLTIQSVIRPSITAIRNCIFVYTGTTHLEFKMFLPLTTKKVSTCSQRTANQLRRFRSVIAYGILINDVSIELCKERQYKILPILCGSGVAKWHSKRSFLFHYLSTRNIYVENVVGVKYILYSILQHFLEIFSVPNK
jgi:hypothetical protein